MRIQGCFFRPDGSCCPKIINFEADTQYGGGTYTITVEDRVGNIAQISFELIEDNQGPSVEILENLSSVQLVYTAKWGIAENSGAPAASYDVQTLDPVSGAWTDARVGTVETSLEIVGDTEGTIYNGVRIRATDWLGNVSEWTNFTDITINAVTKYYTLGGQTVAMRQAGEVYYLASDHLGSTSLVTDAAGQVEEELRYTPYGEIHWPAEPLPHTDRTFTGQQGEDFGLLDYHARWYDPALGRFVQADTIVPEPGSPLAWDRYAYSNNNPTNYSDPDGHSPLLVTALLGANIGAGVDYGYQVAENLVAGMDFSESLTTNIMVDEIVGAAVAGGVAGLTMGVGTLVMASAGVGGTASVLGAAAFGGVGNALGGQVGALAQAGYGQINDQGFNQQLFIEDSLEAGFMSGTDMGFDFATGAIFGAAGQAYSNLSTPVRSPVYQINYVGYSLEGGTQMTLENIANHPGLAQQALITGPVAGLMRKFSDVLLEVACRAADRYVKPMLEKQ